MSSIGVIAASAGGVETLVGVELIYGEHVWPLAEPRTAGPRELPWAAILGALKRHI